MFFRSNSAKAFWLASSALRIIVSKSRMLESDESRDSEAVSVVNVFYWADACVCYSDYLLIESSGT